MESCAEQKKETGWKLPSLSRTTYAFRLMPRHQAKVEMFACETEEHRNVICKSFLTCVHLSSRVEMDRESK